MLQKGLAVLLMSATAGSAGPAATAYWTSGSILHAPATFGAQKLYPVNNASSSRRDRMPGEKTTGTIAKPSSGMIGLGDLSAVGPKGGGAFMEDLMLGAALYLQATQTPLDQEIQAIVSRNFESYWD